MGCGVRCGSGLGARRALGEPELGRGLGISLFGRSVSRRFFFGGRSRLKPQHQPEALAALVQRVRAGTTRLGGLTSNHRRLKKCATEAAQYADGGAAR